jgi:hypothetical protein
MVDNEHMPVPGRILIHETLSGTTPFGGRQFYSRSVTDVSIHGLVREGIRNAAE